MPTIMQALPAASFVQNRGQIGSLSCVDWIRLDWPWLDLKKSQIVNLFHSGFRQTNKVLVLGFCLDPFRARRALRTSQKNWFCDVIALFCVAFDCPTNLLSRIKRSVAGEVHFYEKVKKPILRFCDVIALFCVAFDCPTNLLSRIKRSVAGEVHFYEKVKKPILRFCDVIALYCVAFDCTTNLLSTIKRAVAGCVRYLLADGGAILAELDTMILHILYWRQIRSVVSKLGWKWPLRCPVLKGWFQWDGLCKGRSLAVGNIEKLVDG